MKISAALLAFSLGTATLLPATGYSLPQGPAPAFDPDHDRGGWDAPPAEFREIQRQGFHEGVEGARKDFDHHLNPDVDRHGDFRHPHVSPSARDDYREGYRRGYEVAMHHLMGEAGR